MRRRSTQMLALGLSPSIVLWCCGAGVAGAAPPGASQPPPDAGQLLRDATPAPALPKGDPQVAPRAPAKPAAQSGDAAVKITVASFRITGNASFSSAVLQNLLADGVGKTLSLAELNLYAQRITQYYRDRGFIVARAYIPQQDLVAGELEIVVMEGGLSQVRLDNRSPVASRVIQPYLNVLAEGRPIEAAPLEQQLLLISDLPGVVVTSVLKPGAAVGDSDLEVTATGGPRYAADLSADNYGVRATGQFRAGGTLSINSAAGLGDLLSVDAVSSGSEFSYVHGEYSLPIGGYGTRAGVSAAHLDYRLGGDYDALDAHGTANVGGIFVNQSLMRGYRYNIRTFASFDADKLHDAIDSVAISTDKRVFALTLGLAGDGHDQWGGGGATAWSLKFVSGKLDLDADAAAVDAAATGYRTNGNFDKLSISAIRLQALPDRWSAYVALSGQAADKNLDSSQKFSVGGPNAVRAYQQGEGAADEAWVATVELRYDIAAMPGLELAAFYDGGEARQSRDPLATDVHNSRYLAGPGVSFNWALPARFRVATFLAWRTGDAPVTDRDRSPRVGAQAAYSL